eukprot:Gb_30627 [translate_table: standard]
MEMKMTLARCCWISGSMTSGLDRDEWDEHGDIGNTETTRGVIAKGFAKLLLQIVEHKKSISKAFIPVMCSVWLGVKGNLGGSSIHPSSGKFEGVVASVLVELGRPCKEGGAYFMQWMHCLAVADLFWNVLKPKNDLQGKAIEASKILHALLLPAAKHIHVELCRVATRCVACSSSSKEESMMLCRQLKLPEGKGDVTLEGYSGKEIPNWLVEEVVGFVKLYFGDAIQPTSLMTLSFIDSCTLECENFWCGGDESLEEKSSFVLVHKPWSVRRKFDCCWLDGGVAAAWSSQWTVFGGVPTISDCLHFCFQAFLCLVALSWQFSSGFFAFQGVLFPSFLVSLLSCGFSVFPWLWGAPLRPPFCPAAFLPPFPIFPRLSRPPRPPEVAPSSHGLPILPTACTGSPVARWWPCVVATVFPCPSTFARAAAATFA